MWWIIKFIFQFFFPISQTTRIEEEVREKTSTIDELNNKIRSYDESFANLRKDYENCKHLLQEEKAVHTKLRNNLLLQNQQITILEEENIKLKDEASKYQLALGNATNFRFSDDDQNNPMHLKFDIENLQNIIEDYVTNLKNGIKINFENVNNLLSTYGSQTKIIPRTPDRQLIKAVLQQHVLKEILSYPVMCFEGRTETFALESNMIRNVNNLIELIKRFSQERAGVDEVTRVASIKLRQQVYSILGNRGYANMYEKKVENKHPFLSIFQRKLNDTMSEYREFIDPKKRIIIEEKAEILIQEVTRIFKFRFMTQEPMVEFYWMDHGTKIVEECVETHYENFKNSLVDICSFPLICRDLSNRTNRKILALAKVIPIRTD
ncbi:17606_t:CDS:1 [Gigaspora margarita]|uniref:17606_t:CDS:1 n=1 Tax=Gigaspora margarita TaxID=4874 RepID=A0ABN7UFQ3_GIGMA|nr:17606_t:CDS:1 [Gigaspora margarita]